MWKEETINKLKILLDVARREVPYYTSILPPVSIQLPDDIFGYLKNFPLLSRQILQTQKALLCSSHGDISSWRKIRTTGTTGEPVEVILNKETWTLESELFASHIDRYLQRLDWHQKKIFYLNLHPSASSRTLPSKWHDEAQMIKWNLIRIWQLSDEKFMNSIECLNESIITTMASVVELICSRILKSGIINKIHPSLIVLSGETILPETRMLINEVFKCPVTSLYTMAEVGIIGSEQIDPNVYQVEESAVIVEIVDENGNRVPQGIEGEIIITPLNNVVMPLIRYRTGDRGYWVDIDSSPPIFRLVEARRSYHLITENNASMNVVRFTKMLASLNVDRYRMDQKQDGTVIFSYYSQKSAFSEMDYSLVKSVIRGAFGPEVRIEFYQVEDRNTLSQAPDQIQPSREYITSPNAEPLDPSLVKLASWLRQQLFDEIQIDAAILTGSALDHRTTTRFSDIDLVVLVQNNPMDSYWIKVSRNLISHIPQLSINFDYIRGLSYRSPLLACRLLCEQIPVIGKVDEYILPWPKLENLRLQGLYWSQDTIGTLWLRLVNLKVLSMDPIREAWIATKLILEALRYRYLVRSEHETSSVCILNKLEKDIEIPDLWKRDLFDMFNVAREHLPPPLINSNIVEHYLQLALSYIRFIQIDLMR